MRQVLQHLRKCIVELKDEINDAKSVIEVNREKLAEYEQAVNVLEEEISHGDQ